MINCLKHGLSPAAYCRPCADEVALQLKPFTPTLRQYYAAKAMQGQIAHYGNADAKQSFDIADVMIKFEQEEKP